MLHFMTVRNHVMECTDATAILTYRVIWDGCVFVALGFIKSCVILEG